MGDDAGVVADLRRTAPPGPGRPGTGAVRCFDLGASPQVEQPASVRARKGPADPALVLAFASGLGWQLLSLRLEEAALPLTEALAHKDPFDELLLVQAQHNGFRLLTRDTKLVDHPLAITG